MEILKYNFSQVPLALVARASLAEVEEMEDEVRNRAITEEGEFFCWHKLDQVGEGWQNDQGQQCGQSEQDVWLVDLSPYQKSVIDLNRM